ncbi:MAG: GH3 auxin-responsive promoter family protein [Bacteroidales bacterium]|nr:GH3 auxin-responsive promoter family protein [Bacteroidales bacterium]
MDAVTSFLKSVFSYRLKAISRYGTDFEKIQRRTLSYLLRNAMLTEWGKKYHYFSINDYSDFAKRVPINNYSSLRTYILRMMKGERGILWKGRVKYFATSSGTTSDKIKFIPVSRRGLYRCHLRGGRDVTATYLDAHRDSRIAKGYSLILSGNFNPRYTTQKAKVGDVSAIMASSVPPFFRKMLHFVPSVKESQIQNFYEKQETIASLISEKNLVSFSGTPDWNLMLVRKAMEIKKVTTAEELWPNMELFAHGGMSFLPYRPIFDKLFPSGRLHYIENYNASEGFFGIQNDLSDPSMLLMLDYDVFYEFIPMSEYGKENPKATPLWEVETDVDYAVIISTSSGILRYDIGDVIRFTRKAPYKFIIVGRTHQSINIWGEDLSVQQAEKALSDTCRETGAEVLEFTVAPLIFNEETLEGRHQWLIEFDKKPADLAQFADILQRNLIEDDHDYEHFSTVSGGVLHPLEVIEARKGLFYDWLESKGKLGGQHKVPRLSSSRKYIDELLAVN